MIISRGKVSESECSLFLYSHAKLCSQSQIIGTNCENCFIFNGFKVRPFYSDNLDYGSADGNFGNLKKNSFFLPVRWDFLRIGPKKKSLKKYMLTSINSTWPFNLVIFLNLYSFDSQKEVFFMLFFLLFFCPRPLGIFSTYFL